MSIEASKWALAQVDIKPPARKLVLLVLAWYADPEGVCWPGLKRLAAECSIRERAAREHTRALESGGYLVRERRRGKGGAYTSNQYRLAMTSGTTVPQAEPCRRREDVTTSGTTVPHDQRHHRAAEPSVVEPSVEPPNDLSRKRDQVMVFETWKSETGRTGRTVLSPDRRRYISRALDSYPLADVLAAIRGWRHSPHHRGENERATAYNDLELLLRDSAHIEKFRDLDRRHRGHDDAVRRAEDRRLAASLGQCVDCELRLDAGSDEEAHGQCDQCRSRDLEAVVA